MRFTATHFADAWLVQLEPRGDHRGFFARAFCEQEFRQQGLVSHFVQCNLSANHNRATLRGLHYQAEPDAEVKVVRCIRGAIFDVLVDIRPESPTYLQWQGFELSAENRDALYIPAGFAHGYQTLEPDSEVFYQVSAYYVPAAGRGLRWDDPALKIVWPLASPLLSEQDKSWPLL
jgi:dTDP-4-dehydrorhamnose 3,5-epimerase